MVIELPDTSTQAITRALRTVREERGEISTGRVLTFIVVVDTEAYCEDVINSALDACREHPARVLLLILNDADSAPSASGSTDAPNPRLDAEILLGGDAGASELIRMRLNGPLTENRASVVTPLLLPDTPIVAWWPGTAPRNPSTDPIGALATRRIIDSCHATDDDSIYRHRMTYTPGDTDLAWSRITLWRGLVASLLDQPPLEGVDAVDISGPLDDPAVDIAAGWLAQKLDVPVRRRGWDGPLGDHNHPIDDEGERTISIRRATLVRDKAPITIEVTNATTVRCTVGDQEALVTLAPRGIGDCLAEELRHLDPDVAFGQALKGLARVARPTARRRSSGSVTGTYTYTAEESQR